MSLKHTRPANERLRSSKDSMSFNIVRIWRRSNYLLAQFFTTKTYTV